MSKADERGRQFMEAVGISRRVLAKGRKGAPSCAECYFHCRQLCALDLEAPCSTFRRDSEQGLVPPRQPALLMRRATS